VKFETEAEYLDSPYLRLSKDCGCPAGIANIPGYVSVRGRIGSDADIEETTSRKETMVSRIIRDSFLAQELKLLYDDQCQICGERIELLDGNYSEAHHITPLGRPHNGSDTKDNLIIVCPSCHVRLDYFSIPLRPTEFLKADHEIARRNVDYHNAQHQSRRERIGSRRLTELRSASRRSHTTKHTGPY
jgi:hypothetical protein